MELEIGAIQEGKVTGITKFGAFVLLPGGTSGLVHISVSYTHLDVYKRQQQTFHTSIRRIQSADRDCGSQD